MAPRATTLWLVAIAIGLLAYPLSLGPFALACAATENEGMMEARRLIYAPLAKLPQPVIDWLLDWETQWENLAPDKVGDIPADAIGAPNLVERS